MFTEAFKEKVKGAINLKELVEEYVEVSPVGYNIWQSHCPHPDHNDGTPSFRIWHNKDGSWTWSCMGCHCGKKDPEHKNYGTDCIAFVMWMSDYQGSKHKLSFYEATKLLAQKAGIPIEQEKYSEEYDLNRSRALSYNKNLYKGVRDYLHERGLNDEDIHTWCIGFYSQKEKCAGWNEVPRITFPLFAKYGRILGFSKRKLPSNKDEMIPKYWNSPTSNWFHKRSYLFGIHTMDNSFGEIRITEGVMDVILSQKYEAKNIMAPLGTAFTEEHATFIKESGKTPVFCQDGDAAGQKALRRSIKMMTAIGVYSKVLILPDGMDMADLANQEKENLENYIEQHSLLYWQYIMKDVVTEFDSHVDELRMGMLPAIKQIADSVNTPEEKTMVKSFIKERFGINYDLQ